MVKKLTYLIILFAASVITFSCTNPTKPDANDKSDNSSITSNKKPKPSEDNKSPDNPESTLILSPVTNVGGKSGYQKITLVWTPPREHNFDGIVISGNEISNIMITNGANFKTITNLKDDTNYNFSISTYKGDLKSNPVNISVKTKPRISQFNPADTPTIIGATSINMRGNSKDYFIYEFGVWPQTKLDDVSIIKDRNTTVKINGWDCYTDIYGAYYVKESATAYENNYKFDDGTSIINGQEYYFRLEPIKWRCLTNQYSDATKKTIGSLFLSEKILYPGLFYKDTEFRTTPLNRTIFPNNYMESDIRSILNSYFYNRAFNDKAKEKIVLTRVYNRSSNNKLSKFTCNPTDDHIFPLSEEEANNENYGFTNDSRIKLTTDYSRATGIRLDTPENKIGAWRIRTPSEEHSFNDGACFASFVQCNGDAQYNRSPVESKAFGIVPAFVSTYK